MKWTRKCIKIVWLSRHRCSKNLICVYGVCRFFFLLQKTILSRHISSSFLLLLLLFSCFLNSIGLLYIMHVEHRKLSVDFIVVVRCGRLQKYTLVLLLCIDLVHWRNEFLLFCCCCCCKHKITLQENFHQDN